MRETKRLNDVFSEWKEGNGIFSILQSLDVPWQDDDIAIYLDLEYHGNISGDKYTSPLVFKTVSATPTQADLNLLGATVFELNKRRWAKEWAVYEFEYDPISNYDMTETMDEEEATDYGRKDVRTDNLSRSGSHSETRTPNLTETETMGIKTFEQDYAYGFNATVASPASERKVSPAVDSGNNVKTNTGTEGVSGTESESNTGTQQNQASGTDEHSRDYTLTRKGNIGVTTSQQMIESEMKLWMWDFFRNVVFPDVDKILTLPIY